MIATGLVSAHALVRGRRCGFVRTLIKSAIAAVLACVAIATGAVAAPTPLTPVRIEVPGRDNLQFFNLWVALGAGLFQEEGLEPKIVVAPAPRSVGQSLLRGEVDISLLPPPMFLGFMAEEKPILLFASLLANEPINLVVRKEIAEARNLLANASLKDRLQAIRGVKIGLAGEVSPRLRAMARIAGLDADKDFKLAVVQGPDQVGALANGAVDALFAHTPYLERAIVSHGAVLVADTSGGEVPDLANGQIHALATTRALAKDKPLLIEAVTRAIYRAQRLIHSDPKASVDALLAAGVARDRPLTEAIAAVYGPAVPQTPKISLEGIVRDAALYPAHPRAPDFARVRASDFVAADFAQSAVGLRR
jgi:NitT/TauT family transport system substrate-binding protein